MKYKIRRLLLLIILLILISILAFLFFKIFNNNSKKEDNYVAKHIDISFESRIDKLKTFDSGSLYKFGWLQVQGTDIDVPILDSTSAPSVNDINYSYSWMSPNYNTGENRPVIMGHNILNVSNEPMLPNGELENFEEMMAFTYFGFAKDNLYLQYTTDNSDDIYLIYAAGFYDYDFDNAESYKNKKDIDKYIKKVRKNSIYDYDIDVNSSDDIITIKTCTRYFGSDTKQQFMIEARKLRKDEDTIKYKVEINDNFKKLNLKEENM